MGSLAPGGALHIDPMGKLAVNMLNKVLSVYTVVSTILHLQN